MRVDFLKGSERSANRIVVRQFQEEKTRPVFFPRHRLAGLHSSCQRQTHTYEIDAEEGQTDFSASGPAGKNSLATGTTNCVVTSEWSQMHLSFDGFCEVVKNSTRGGALFFGILITSNRRSSRMTRSWSPASCRRHYLEIASARGPALPAILRVRGRSLWICLTLLLSIWQGIQVAILAGTITTVTIQTSLAGVPQHRAGSPIDLSPQVSGPAAKATRTEPSAPILASNTSPGATGTIGPSASDSTTFPARRGCTGGGLPGPTDGNSSLRRSLIWQ